MTTNFDRRIWMDEMLNVCPTMFFFLEQQQLYLITIPNLTLTATTTTTFLASLFNDDHDLYN
ncbi:hypothetical protein DERF_012033 [Dermatophagoides farinae]|uniref:Uncharacterized protein n=1 Tax=Dermatophagoides farinae TaxID=6954 RepID=A0A922HR61_DERFA|nr:hypothetical protein DERF_012033 [Dermatophagoides farinae]